MPSINLPPTITSNGGGASATVSLPENLTMATIVTASDPNPGTTLQYSIAGGVDGSLFHINSVTGALSFIPVPDFEAPADADHNNSYQVVVRASDGSLTDDQAITVNISDVSDNFAPVTPYLVRPLVQANTVDGGTVQQGGQIIGVDDGGYVIVYNDQSSAFTTDVQTVVGQRFDAAGNKVGSELRVSAFDDGEDSVADGSSITKLHNGNIAFTYTDLFQGDNDVWVRVLNPALGVIRDDAIDTGSAQTKNASITSFADGSYAVSYTVDNGGGNTDIVARIVSATGVVGAPITVRDNGTLDANFSQVATLSNNTFVDVFQQHSGFSNGIYLAIYTAGGAQVAYHDVFGANDFADETDPDVAALVGGGFVVGWTDAEGDSNIGGQGPRMSIYDNAGHLVAGDLQIHTTTQLAQNEVSLVALNDGGFVATWEDDAYVMVRGQRFDATGHAIGGEFVVKDNNFQPVDTQDGALLADGRFAFALGDLKAGDSDVTTSIWSVRNTAAFSGNLASYTINDLGTKITVSGPDGNDTLVSIEHLQFSDGMINLNDGDAVFDTAFYDHTYLDVFHAGVDALNHYNTSGWHEGRDPNAFFSTKGYLGANPDVKAAGINPLTDYEISGWQEGRDPSANFDTTLYLLHNQDVGMNPLQHYLSLGMAEGRTAYAAIGENIVNGFDAEYYLLANPDVAAAGVDPLQHFMTAGWHEGRNPNGYFDTKGYLAAYADVAAAGVNPLTHYEATGWHEGRDPSGQFDTLHYLSAYADVAAAHINPLDHFLAAGAYELRSTFADGLFH